MVPWIGYTTQLAWSMQMLLILEAPQLRPHHHIFDVRTQVGQTVCSRPNLAKIANTTTYHKLGTHKACGLLATKGGPRTTWDHSFFLTA